MNVAKHLQEALDSYRVNEESTSIKLYKEKREQIKNGLIKHFNGSLHNPLNSGSLAKHTEINCKYDFDIVAPFTQRSYGLLRDMFDDTFNYFNDNYKKGDGDLIEVKKQKVSIGLKFYLNNKTVDFDVVPGRKINENDTNPDLNLYVNDLYGNINQGTYLKTNIKKQIQHIRDNTEARHAIRLLKAWKYHNNLPAKSFLIELITIRAYQDSDISKLGGLDNQLVGVLDYIDRRIHHLRLQDPGNDNNNVMDTLSEGQKIELANQSKSLAKLIRDESNEVAYKLPISSQTKSNPSRTRVKRNDFG